jgi:uncharacterized protein YbjT (DUF2867 family)
MPTNTCNFAQHNLSVFDPASFLGQTLLTKSETEKVVKAFEFPHFTILRGASFMDNFLAPKVFMYGALAASGTWNIAFLSGIKIPYVDANDIAKFALAAFQDPTKFSGQEINIAGDELTPEEVVEQLSEVVGKKITFVPVTDEEIEARKAAGDPMAVAQLALRELPKFVKLDETKSWGIPMASFGGFLERNKELVNLTYASLEG